MKVGISENVIGTLTGISNMMKGISAETKVLEANLGRIGTAFAAGGAR
jgi:hypothetical protein